MITEEPHADGKAQPGLLLTGGSGLVGEAIRAELAERGARVLRAVRPVSGRAAATGGDSIAWNPMAPVPFAATEALEGLHAAVHLSGANLAARRWTPAYKREIVQSRMQSTAAVARTLAGLARPPAVLISASATGIYGDRGDELLNEDSAPGSGFLADGCRAWEAAAAPAVEAGMRVVFLRLGVVLSPRDGALAKMLPLFRAGLGGRLGDGRQWMSWIALEDVVSAVMHIADIPAAGQPSADRQGGRFTERQRRRAAELRGPVNCVAPGPVTNAEFTRTLAATLHRPGILAAPALALRLAMGEMADAALLASCRAMPDRLLESGFPFQFPLIGGALAHLLG